MVRASQVLAAGLAGLSTAGAIRLFSGRAAAINQPPTAAFTFSPANPTAGEVVSFDGGDSSDPDGSIVLYEWTFGDGSTGGGATTSNIYASAGDYTVELTVTDDDGQRATATQTVSVSSGDTTGGYGAGAYGDSDGYGQTLATPTAA